MFLGLFIGSFLHFISRRLRNSFDVTSKHVPRHRNIRHWPKSRRWDIIGLVDDIKWRIQSRGCAVKKRAQFRCTPPTLWPPIHGHHTHTTVSEDRKSDFGTDRPEWAGLVEPSLWERSLLLLQNLRVESGRMQLWKDLNGTRVCR